MTTRPPLFILVLGLLTAACQVELSTDTVYACTSDDQCIESYTCLDGACVAKDSPPADASSGSVDTTAPIEDTTAPVEDTADSVEDTTTPLEDTTTPVEDATDPVEDTTTPVEDATDPVEDTADALQDSGQPTEDTSDTVADAAEPDPCDYEIAEGEECDPVCQVGCAEGEACGLAMEALNCLTPGPLEVGEPCSVDTLDCAAGLSCLTIPEIAPEDVCFTHCASDADCPLSSCGIDYSDASGASLGFCLPEPCSDVADCCTELGGCLIDEICIQAGDSSPAEPCFVCEPGLDKANWSHATAGAPCDDGDPCTLEDLCSDEGQCLPGEPLICSGDNPCEDYACGAEGLCEATWKEANAPCGEGICDAAGACLLSCTAPALEGAECNFFCGQSEQGCGADQVCALEAGAQSCVNADVATGGLLAPCSGPDSLCESGYVCAYLEAEQGKRCLPVCSNYADGESACPDGLACELDMSLSLGGDTSSTITLCVPTEPPCPVPFEDLCPCPIPQGSECSPYCGASEQGCAEGTSCALAEGDDTLLCAETGTLKAGEPCATWDDCGVGLTCVTGENGLACRSFCQSGSDCAEIFPSTECELVPLSNGTEVGVCTEHLACDLPYPTGAACNAYCPAGAQGCGDDETCILNENNTFECSSEGGTLSTDAVCLSHEDCTSGHVCTNSPFQSEKICQPFCVTSDDCPTGRECNIWYYAGPDLQFQMWMCEPPQCEGCIIDGACVLDGEPHPDPANTCLECNKAMSAESWSPVYSDTCYGLECSTPAHSDDAECNPFCDAGAQGCIAGDTCIFDYHPELSTAAVCKATESAQKEYGEVCSDGECATGLFCVALPGTDIGTCNQVCSDDKPCPEDFECALNVSADAVDIKICEPPACEGCVIDGACVPEGAPQPDTPCFACVSASNLTGWTMTPDVACDDADLCTDEDTCSLFGECIGSPSSSPTCNGCFITAPIGAACNPYCPMGAQGCEDGQGCLFVDATQSFICGDVGEGSLDAPCSSNSSCQTGHICTSIQTQTSFLCNKLCTSHDDCPADRPCGASYALDSDILDMCEAEPCPACKINGQCRDEGSLNPANQCQACLSEISKTTWSLAEGFACDDDDDCSVADTCEQGQCIGDFDFDNDGTDNCTDPDIDNDVVENDLDPDDYNTFICGDSDDDGCDDCAVAGTANSYGDGKDSDADGLCDLGDPDDDGDGIPDAQDSCPFDANVEIDGDTDGFDAACDCNDADPTIYPGAVEACDGVDTDCDGILPDNEQDLDADSYVGCNYQGTPWLGSIQPNIGKDCDDNNHQYWEKLSDTELCDGVDSNCDGVLPEGEFDLDGDGYVACMNNGETWLGIYGEPTNGFGDCDPANDSVHPGAEELCDGVKNNCNDETIASNEVDDDGDGYIECNGWLTTGWMSPEAPPLVGIDCNDNNKAVYPGADELCDGVKNDCNAETIASNEVDGDEDGFVPCPYDPATWMGNESVTGGLDCNDGDTQVTDCPDDEHCIPAATGGYCSPNP
ncbi:MAG: MopE-related protein [Myxococcota bacterium]